MQRLLRSSSRRPRSMVTARFRLSPAWWQRRSSSSRNNTRTTSWPFHSSFLAPPLPFRQATTTKRRRQVPWYGTLRHLWLPGQPASDVFIISDGYDGYDFFILSEEEKEELFISSDGYDDDDFSILSEEEKEEDIDDAEGDHAEILVEDIDRDEASRGSSTDEATEILPEPSDTLTESNETKHNEEIPHKVQKELDVGIVQRRRSPLARTSDLYRARETLPEPRYTLTERSKTKRNKKKGSNPFSNLESRRIPGKVQEELDTGTFLKGLRRFSSMTLSGYAHYWRCLLWAAEWYEKKLLMDFDMAEAELLPELPGGKRREHWWFLAVPGLAEDRPSVLPGDAVRIKLPEGSKEYQGTVVEVYLQHIRIECRLAEETFDPTKDLVHVRFLPSTRLNYILGHYGTSNAKVNMPLESLAPIWKHASSTVRKMRHKVMNEDGLPPNIQHVQWRNPALNEEQRQAVCQVLQGANRPLPYVLIGPPGTGKSATVTEMVLQWLEHNPESRILVLAPSNDAADVLLNKLHTFMSPSEMVRIVSFRRLAQVPDHLGDYLHLNSSEYGTTLNTMMNARCTVSTVNMATRFACYGVNPGDFGAIVIDEAGHATEPDTITAVSTLLDFTEEKEGGSGVGQLVLAGDPKQLGPVVLHRECSRLGLDRSFMERLSEYHIYKRNKKTMNYEKGLVTMLTRNYRSHEAIIRLPNEIYYDGALTCHADLSTTHNMCDWDELPQKDFPLFFHAVAGENQREETSPSWFNPQEVEVCTNYALSLVRKEGLKCEEIGIITPYTAQVAKIREALKEEGLADIKVGSVETFQGQERRTIILSTVRSAKSHLKEDKKTNLGFVASNKRFNVAVTRAQALLIVVGCPDVLATDKNNWLPFLEYCHTNHAWKGEEWNRAP